MNKNIKLGIIGLSEGNGHPYSWSAIFNGYNPKIMQDCGFPVIPAYLAKQKFPDDCIPNAHVTHIWTQDKNLSQKVAQAALISTVCNKMEDMIGQVDAVLLARDDAENHFEMSKPFILAGLPIYIDKPLACSLTEADKIYSLEQYEGQIFTCSALAYAPSLLEPKDIGKIEYIDATIFKDWKKYGIHIIEPVMKLLGINSTIISHTLNCYNNNTTLSINWSNNITTTFKTLYQARFTSKITIYGTKGSYEISFNDTFNSFKNALQEFINIINKKVQNNSKLITLKSIEVIEKGNHE